MLRAQDEAWSTAVYAREVALDAYGHRFDLDTDRCVCGSAWIRFESEETYGPEEIYGCEAAGPPPFPLAFDGRGRVTRWQDGCLVHHRKEPER